MTTRLPAVAIISPYDLGRPGGVQDQAAKLTRWLGAAGHRTALVGPGRHPDVETISLGEATVVPANGARTPIILRPGVRRRLEAATRDFDVLHVHEPLMPAVSIAALGLGRPTVATFHADPSPLVRRLYRATAPIGRRLLGRAVATAVSPVAAEAASPIRPDVRIIPNGIDTAAYATGPKEPGKVLFLGRDDPRKGLDVALAAWPHVVSRHPHAELHVVGASRPHGPASVVFHGRVPEEEKIAHLAAASILLAPNRSGESFGLVVAEGMASACAVVASSIPAFRHVLGEAGVLVPPGDAAALAAAAVALLDDEERRRELGERARDRVKRFDRATVVAGYQAAYREAVAD